MIKTHKLLDCNKMIKTHKLLDCNKMIKTHQFLDCNEMIVTHKWLDCIEGIVTHKLLDCNKMIVTHKLLDCIEGIVTHKLLDCNKMTKTHKLLDCKGGGQNKWTWLGPALTKGGEAIPDNQSFEPDRVHVINLKIWDKTFIVCVHEACIVRQTAQRHLNLFTYFSPWETGGYSKETL